MLTSGEQSSDLNQYPNPPFARAIYELSNGALSFLLPILVSEIFARIIRILPIFDKFDALMTLILT